MKIGEKILNLRKQKGLSQEQLALELGVSRQAVSKWESEQAVPDLDKVLMLSSFFGVCTDYLLKDEMLESVSSGSDLTVGKNGDICPEGTVASDATQNAAYYEFADHSQNKGKLPIRTVSAEEALHYKTVRNTSSLRIAIGVCLCIMSVTPMVALDELLNAVPKLENYMSILMMLMIATAVGLFVISGMALSKFEYLEKEPFILSDSILMELETEAEDFQKKFGIRIAVGVVFCVLSTIPAIATDTIGGMEEGIGCSMLFVFVAIGVYQFVRYGILHGTYTILLQREDHTIKAKTSAKTHLIGQIMGIYWCVITAVYLAVSFVTRKWDYSWIIWPVAGVLCGAIAIICNLAIREEE